MMKTMKSLFPMLLLAAGLLTWSGCSKDDDKTESPADVIPASPLTEAASSFNEQMAGLNFQELEPLAEVVPATTRADDNSIRSEFETKLSALLSLLQDEQTGRRSAQMGHRFSFHSFNNALQLAWDLSVILGDEDESSSSWFGLNSTKQGEVNYTAKNGNQYLVKGIVDKETTIQFRGLKTKVVVKKAGEFYIYKDGEEVLKILSGSENNRPVWLPVLIQDNFFTGQMYYRDYEINLTYDKHSAHQRTLDLIYGKSGEEVPLLTMSAQLEDDADVWKILKHDVNVHADFTVTAMGVLTFVGTSNNVNYLVVDGVRLSRCMKEGTTEQECKELVERFNENLTLDLLLSDVSMGWLYMGVQQDASTNRYYPTVMIHTTILGEEDYPVTMLLQMMGVDIPDILLTAAQINGE